MNEYSMGALEALSWGQMILRKQNLNVATKEVELALKKLVRGTGIDFGKRIERL